MTQDAAGFSQTDIDFMNQALRLGAFGTGLTAPNPAVGCVLVSAAGEIVGTGWTQKSGRPHAEAVALAEAGERARGATAYVTLEPCAHHGKTAPCADALIEAGIARLVYAMADPDPRTAGQGAQKCAAAGINVQAGLLAEQAARAHLGFVTRLTQARPMVTLKLAVSKNGFMRTPQGQSPWITGALARNYGHLLRAQHDVILTGSGTVRADDPSLDCRLPGMTSASPQIAIMSRDGKLTEACKLAQKAQTAPVLLYCENGEAAPKAFLQLAFQHLTPHAVLHHLASRGYTRVLLESGPRLAAGFLADNMVDAIALFAAPHDVDIEGESDISAMGLADMAGFTRSEVRMLGDDQFSLWHSHKQAAETSARA